MKATILLLPVVFFIACWLLLYRMKAKKIKRIVFATIGSALLCALMPAIILCGTAVWSNIRPIDHRKFDHNEWQTDINHRYLMSKDLIESNALDDKTADQVVEILGDSLCRITPDTIYYCAGSKPSVMTFIPQVLVIILDQGKVTEVKRTSMDRSKWGEWFPCGDEK